MRCQASSTPGWTIRRRNNVKLVDCLKKQVLDPDPCPIKQSQEIELVEEENDMKVRITGTGDLVWTMHIRTQDALKPMFLKGDCGLSCDYLIIVQSGGNDYVVFVEMKSTWGRKTRNKGREQLRRSLPLWDYLCSICKIECRIAPEVSVKYVLIAEKENERFARRTTRKVSSSGAFIEEYRNIMVKTLIGNNFPIDALVKEGKTSCRVGITTDPDRRKTEWELKYPNLHDWKILHRGLSKTEAQTRETEESRARGCDSGPGGRESEDDKKWSVYYFKH